MSERGVAESTQWAMLLPALMLSVLGMIQAGIWLHGRTAVSNAAAAAAEQVAWGQASDSEASQLGQRIAESGGVTGVAVRVERSPQTVRVVVTGRAVLFLDFGQGQLSEVAAMPMERVTRP